MDAGDYSKSLADKTPFTYPSIVLCTNFYYCTSHVVRSQVRFPFPKLLKWGLLSRRRLPVNGCFNWKTTGEPDSWLYPNQTNFYPTSAHHHPLASEQCLRSSNEAWQHMPHPVTVTPGRPLCLVKLSSVSGRALRYYCLGSTYYPVACLAPYNVWDYKQKKKRAQDM